MVEALCVSRAELTLTEGTGGVACCVLGATLTLTQGTGGNRLCVRSDADLGRQDVEVARAVGLADELARVLGRHPRVFRHPHHGRRAAVGVEAEAVECRALLVAIALTYSTQQQDGGGGVGGGGGERQGNVRGGGVASGGW